METDNMTKKEPLNLLSRSREQYGEFYSEHLFEQYKHYVESAEKISERRVSANNYFLTVNSFLVTLYGLVASSKFASSWLILVPFAGLLVSLTWHRIITSYRDLNTIKFSVIHELEEQMPAALYAYEWKKAQYGKGKKYHPLSHLERWIPIIFMLLYVILAVLGGLNEESSKINPDHKASSEMSESAKGG
jgi:hypothetical protein